MSAESTKSVQVSEDVHYRMKVIAERNGATVDDFADSALRAHVDDVEHGIIEAAEDERRWEHYLNGGKTIPADEFRKKLHRLAAQAAAKVEM